MEEVGRGGMEGVRVAVTAARQGHVLVRAFERCGATVLWAPTVAGDEPGADALGQLDALLARRPEWLVASTGVAVRMLVDVAERSGRANALRDLLEATKVVARGMKADGAVRALGITPVFVSPQETDCDTAAWLARHVLWQDAVGVLIAGAGGADAYRTLGGPAGSLLVAHLYRSSAPAEAGPVSRLLDAVCAGELDVIVCTSPASFRNLVAVAGAHDRQDELVEALSARVGVAVVGPVTARAVEDAGAPVALMPLRQRTAELVRAVEAWASRGGRCRPGPLKLRPTDHRVALPEGTLQLGEREFFLLAALVRRPEVVCPADRLAVEVWGHAAPDDPHAVKHLVCRVRRKLGPLAATVETIRSVGYRYDPLARVTNP